MLSRMTTASISWESSAEVPAVTFWAVRLPQGA
jgi:hypothetical protein